jgi:hypothetical protein
VVVQHQNNDNGNDKSNNCKALYSLMLSKNWFSALTSIEVNPDVTFAWFTNLECDAHFLPIHAAIMLKGPALIVSELLSVHPGSALIRNKQGFIPLHLVLCMALHEVCFSECYLPVLKLLVSQIMMERRLFTTI